MKAIVHVNVEDYKMANTTKCISNGLLPDIIKFADVKMKYNIVNQLYNVENMHQIKSRFKKVS
jgi:hypothetical protein